MNLGEIFADKMYRGFPYTREATWDVQLELSLEEAADRYKAGLPLAIVGVQSWTNPMGSGCSVGLAWRLDGEQSFELNQSWQRLFGATTIAFQGNVGQNSFYFFVPGVGFGSYVLA